MNVIDDETVKWMYENVHMRIANRLFYDKDKKSLVDFSMSFNVLSMK